ncbi:MAG: hypothetical protein KG028_16055 [Actinobacteria bacterium]|nr:hypothetical protein [Actinomycetota bacterium]
MKPWTRTRKTVAAGGLAAALAIVGVLPALAQDADDTTTDDTTTETTRAWDDLRAEHRAAFAEKLAERLGLDADEVATALEEVRELQRAESETLRLEHLTARLDEAVAAGHLTQEQADAMLEAHENGEMPFGGGRRGGATGHHGRGMSGGMSGGAGMFGGGMFGDFGASA